MQDGYSRINHILRLLQNFDIHTERAFLPMLIDAHTKKNFLQPFTFRILQESVMVLYRTYQQNVALSFRSRTPLRS